MKKTTLLFICFLLFCWGCDLSNHTDNKTEPYIEGVVTDKENGTTYDSILVEDLSSLPTEKKAWLILTESTEIYFESVEEDNLDIGYEIKVWITGMVEDTDPERAVASQIIIVNK